MLMGLRSNQALAVAGSKAKWDSVRLETRVERK